MIQHPLAVIVLAADAIGTAAVLSAAGTGMSVLAGWRPQSADSSQLRLEARAESASMRTRFGLWALSLSSLLLVVGITGVLPQTVPGAMCGTGVLQAMDGHGGRALAFRLLGLGTLFVWRVLDRLDRGHPEAPLAVPLARTLLLSIPFLLLAWIDTVGAFRALNTSGAVDCCAAVYDRFGSLEEAVHTAGLPDAAWLGLAAFLGLGLATAAAAALRRKDGPGPAITAWVAALAVLWSPAAVVALVRVLAAYHYEVLQHHCPWCLFLPEHRCVGFLLFGLMAVVLFEGVTSCVAAGIAGRFPCTVRAAQKRARSACRRLIFSLAAFTAAAGLPALVWRLRFGVWMG
jgi:hypothetical protein